MPLEIVYGSKRSGLTLLGELCPECGKARMLHPELYVFTCPHCRFSYMVHPVSAPFSRGITLLHKSKYKRGK